MLDSFTMTSAPAAIGDKFRSAGIGSANSGSSQTDSQFGGLYDAARSTSQESSAQENPRAQVASGPTKTQASATSEGDANASKQPTDDRVAEGLPGDDTLDEAHLELPALSLTADKDTSIDASLDPLKVSAAEDLVQAIPIEPLEITSEMPLGAPNLPSSGGSSIPPSGNSLPAAGPGVGGAVAAAMQPSPLPTPTPTPVKAPASGTDAMTAASLSSIATDQAGAGQTGPAAVTAAASGAVLKADAEAQATAVPATRDNPAPTTKVEAPLVTAVKADLAESSSVAVASAPRTPAPETAGDVPRPGQQSPQLQANVSTTVPASPRDLSAAANADLLPPAGRTAPESPVDARPAQSSGLVDAGNAYALAGRTNGVARTPGLQDGLNTDNRVKRSPIETGVNPRTVAPLEAGVAAALARPGAPRSGSGSTSTASSDPDALSALIEPAADTSPESTLSSATPGTRSADGILRADVGRLDPALGAQVTAQLARQIQQGMGSSSLHIKLNPSELGQVDVQLRVDGDRVHVAIVTHQVGTRDLIEAHLAGLRSALENGGLTLGDVDVRHGAQGEREALAGDTDSQRRGRRAAALSSVESASTGRLATEGSSGRTIDAFV